MRAAPPPLLAQLLAPIRRRWWLMPVMVAVILVLVLIKLNRDAAIWTAELQVFSAPAAAGVAPKRGIAGLAAQAGGGLAALAGSLGSGDSEAPFSFFLDGLATPEVAAQLARNPVIMHKVFASEWDVETQSWHPPRGVIGRVQGGLFSVLGLPALAWRQPDAERLRAYIADAIKVTRSVKSPLVTLSHEHWDRAFAGAFLEQLSAAADDNLRQSNAARTAANIDYLSARLATTSQAEVREALVAALGQEERSAMLAAARLPYAAETFGVAKVSRWPSRPRPVPLLLAGVLAGLLLGAALAVWLDRRTLRLTPSASA